MKKTLFIVISQGMIVRNILRSRYFDMLKNSGHRIVIFFLIDEVPEYLKKEFSHPNIVLESISNKSFKVSKLHKAFIIFTHFLIYTKTTKRFFTYSRNYIDKPRMLTGFYVLLLNIFSRLKFLRPMTRLIERNVFKEENDLLKKYFDQYNPDLVFSTSITSKADNAFMKEAKRRKVKIISMTKSWDNTTKMFFRFVPDYLIVQNEDMKKQMIGQQRFPADRIYITGFPQFDWYSFDDVLMSRENYFVKRGFDPNKSLIFFGSSGDWSKADYKLAELISDWIERKELIKSSQLLIRPHFSNVKTSLLRNLKARDDVFYDQSLNISDVFSDNWDPTTEEIIDFVNLMHHSDVVVNILSTLSLDAACCDRPIINVLFDVLYRKGKDVSGTIEDVEHYKWVFRTGATSKAESADELKSLINQYLANPSMKSNERQVLKNELCYGGDNKSGERVFQTILNILNK